MTDAERAVRERVRLQAVACFEGGEKNREIAAALRVSERSVERWRRQWREERPRRGDLQGVTWQTPIVRRADGQAAARVGAWSAGTRLDRSAVDPGAGEDDDRPVVPRLVHGGGHVAVAATARLVVAAARPTGNRA